MSNTPGKSKNVFLYLALACFLGIILIFVFDGYMGLYDTLTMTSGEFPLKIDADQWQDQERFNYIPPLNINYGGRGTFSYEIDNRRFFSYDTDINVSVWRSQAKVADIVTETLNIGVFGNSLTEWVFDTAEYLPEDLPVNTTVEFTMLISHGNTERKLLVYVYSAPSPGIKVIPPPTE